jgi:hypothetical protein
MRLQSFMNRIRALEESLFADQLDPVDATRMKSPDYSWLYRPSHHIQTGLITEKEIDALKKGKRLLSVGAYPAYLERLLIELGVPAENIVVTDSNPQLSDHASPLQSFIFDCTKDWPDLGLFDLIIFPESLCIALTDRIKQENIPADGEYPTDALEAELLTHILQEALSRLSPDGVIRANGPMSHPKVYQMVQAELDQSGFTHQLAYQRYFVSIRKGE